MQGLQSADAAEAMQMGEQIYAHVSSCNFPFRRPPLLAFIRPFAFRGVDGRPPDERPLRIHRLRVLQLHPGRIAAPLRSRHRPHCLIQKRKEDGSPSFDRLNGRWTMNKIGNSCGREEAT